MAQVTKQLKIKGRVQGVGFRYSFQMVATRLGLKGWVRNNRDGSVEAIVQGEENLVSEVVHWSYKGPTAADVTDVEVTDVPGQFDDFSIRESV